MEARSTKPQHLKTLADLDQVFDLRTSPAAIAAVLRSCIDAISTPRLRKMREFAEAEIRITSGPKPGLFKASSQPFAAIWLDLVDSGQWNRFVTTGPSQSGKTVTCFVIPICYHTLEIGENVICLVPDFDFGQDKWSKDILPIIERSRYRKLLPTEGPGSRGGKISASNPGITFKNGAQLLFITGAGNDTKRAGKTSRVLVITEADRMDKSSEASDEPDKLTQATRRIMAHGEDGIIYAECTLSREDNMTAREIAAGTNTRILVNCVKCHASVTPEREDLHGWREAKDIIEAKETSRFICPKCQEEWSDADRVAMNEAARVMHRGQELDADGNIVGTPARTDTLGYRWNAFNNLFLSPGFIAMEEFRAARDPNQDNSERAMRIFMWALPVLNDTEATVNIDAMGICSRYTQIPKDIVPPGTLYLAGGLDLGKRDGCHYVIEAAWENFTCQVVTYGVIDVDWKRLGLEAGLMKALRDFHLLCETGWTIGGTSIRRQPDRVMIDSGYQGAKNADVVYEFIRSVGLTGRYWPTKGYGTDTELAEKYRQPQQIGGNVVLIGDNYHVTALPEKGVYLLHFNADHWKGFVHNRLDTLVEQPGALTLFNPGSSSHLNYAKHILAEIEHRKFVQEKGYVEQYVRKHRKNHYLDATALASLGNHLKGARLSIIAPPKPPMTEVIRPGEAVTPFVRPIAAETPGFNWIRKV